MTLALVIFKLSCRKT